MRSVIAISAALLLGGCTLNIVDKRLTREEVAEALKQRDQALEILALKIKELEGKGEKK